MATGAGKTLTAAHILHGFLERADRAAAKAVSGCAAFDGGKDHPGIKFSQASNSLAGRTTSNLKRCAFVVPAIALVDQTVAAFQAEGLTDIGVIQASHPLHRPLARVQVCSVQTLARRGFPAVDLMVVDECHMRSEALWRFLKDTPQTLAIGLSATPWASGMGVVWDDLIVGATTKQLIDAGHLSPYVAYAPSKPDMTGVKVKTGEWDEAQSADAMAPLTADIVKTWLAKGENEPTLCFATTRAHANHLQDAFEAEGVSAGYVDAYSTSADRAKLKRKFEAGDIRVVCNVGVLTTGVDWDVRCIILARPTRSKMLLVQIVGRGLRTAPGKERMILLDHSDTLLTLGLPCEIFQDHLSVAKPAKSESKSDPPLPKECPACKAIKRVGVRKCEACGFEPELQPELIEVEPGELTLIKGVHKPSPYRKTDPTLASGVEKAQWLAQFVTYADEHGYKRGWAYNKYIERFGVKPVTSVNHHPGGYDITPHVASWIKSRQIAWAKSKSRNDRASAQL